MRDAKWSRFVQKSKYHESTTHKSSHFDLNYGLWAKTNQREGRNKNKAIKINKPMNSNNKRHKTMSNKITYNKKLKSYNTTT